MTRPFSQTRGLSWSINRGFPAKKQNISLIGYKSISRFGIETAGTFDLDAELKIRISSETKPSIVKKTNKSANVYDVQKALAGYVL